MAEIIRQNSPFVCRIVSKNEAVELFRKMGEDYKVELLGEIPDEEVSLYEEGGFVDLCRGPHIESAGKVTAFKLLSIAGAYWRGNEKNKMLQRIYGTSFPDKKDLTKYLDFLNDYCVQTFEHCRCILARQRKKQDAPENLWHIFS